MVSLPVLVEAQCWSRQPTEVRQRLLELCPTVGVGDTGGAGSAGKTNDASSPRSIRDLGEFLETLLGLEPDLFDGASDGNAGDLPDELSHYAAEGRQRALIHDEDFASRLASQWRRLVRENLVLRYRG